MIDPPRGYDSDVVVNSIRLFIGALAVSGVALADTATFFPVADTTISQFNEAIADGSSATMITGHLPIPDAPARGLFRFDLSSLPSGVVVTSVTVELTVTVVADSVQNIDQTHLLHRLTLNWTEAGATWEGTGGGFWENEGGDYENTADASRPVTGLGTYIFASTAGLVNTVQLWATNAAANFGWALRSAEEDSGRTGRRFATREAFSDRPKLVVGYFVPPPPVALENPRVVGTNFLFEFTAQTGSSYTVQYKPVVDAGDWSVLSAHPAPGGPTVIPVQDALTPTNRFYRVISP